MDDFSNDEFESLQSSTSRKSVLRFPPIPARPAWYASFSRQTRCEKSIRLTTDKSSKLPYIYYLCIQRSAFCTLQTASRTHDRDWKGLACCAAKISPWGAGALSASQARGRSTGSRGQGQGAFDWTWDGICLTPVAKAYPCPNLPGRDAFLLLSNQTVPNHDDPYLSSTNWRSHKSSHWL